MTTLIICTLFFIILLYHILYSQIQNREKVINVTDRWTDPLSKNRQNEMYTTTISHVDYVYDRPGREFGIVNKHIRQKLV